MFKRFSFPFVNVISKMGTGQFLPGQFPSVNYPPRQLPPDNHLLDSYPYANCPPGKYPPDKYPLTIAHCANCPPGQFPPPFS